MVNYITIFDKLLEYINWKILQYSAYKLNTDFKVSKFFTKDHLKSMIYFHIAEHNGMRDLTDSAYLSPRLRKLVKSVSLTTISNHNNKRNYKVFEPVMVDLISKAMNSISVSEAMKKFGSVKLIDSTTISSCIKYFEWALFRRNKADIKIHTSFDLAKGIPDCFIVSNAKDHDSTKLDELMQEENCTYVFDKAYNDYKKFDEFTEKNKYFVTRIKDNAVITLSEELEIKYATPKLLDEKTRIIFDQLVYLGSKNGNRTKKEFRIIKIIDKEDRELTFVTNLFDLSSEEIGWLYKKRWEIELFFKWIKQNLKFKTFIGHSLNVIMIQIITGIMAFVLIKMVEKSDVELSLTPIQIRRKIRQSLTELISIELFTWNIWINTS